MAILEVNQVSKSYGQFKAVDLEKTEIIAYPDKEDGDVLNVNPLDIKKAKE